MTPHQSKILAHLVTMAQTQKAYAWWASKNFAELDPELADMPRLLTAAMKNQASAAT